MASDNINETYSWLRAAGFMKGPTMTDLAAHSLVIGTLVKVRGFSGVACTYQGPEIERIWRDEEEETEEEETGRAIVIMVGDDHKHVVDFDDMTLISDDENVCSCGQLGCWAEVSA